MVSERRERNKGQELMPAAFIGHGSPLNTLERNRLDDIQYPAPGLPELAEQVAEIVKPRWVGQDYDAWGLDHGTWSVLAHIAAATEAS
jgi:aromatic ring-opening dioxygenase catalytic subunit (LigB family)